MISRVQTVPLRHTRMPPLHVWQYWHGKNHSHGTVAATAAVVGYTVSDGPDCVGLHAVTLSYIEMRRDLRD